MPALSCDITVEAGSYEPQYWEIRDSAGDLIDLTVSGFEVNGVAAKYPSGATAAFVVPDSCWSREASGRLYFQPGSTVSAGWPAGVWHFQAELAHPSGQTVRILSGRLTVVGELVSED